MEPSELYMTRAPNRNVYGVNDALLRCASKAGINLGLAAYHPLPAAFLALLHLFPKLRRLRQLGIPSFLPTLILARFNYISGGSPECLNHLTHLALGEHSGFYTWPDSPMPLILSLPRLHSVVCYHWCIQHQGTALAESRPQLSLSVERNSPSLPYLSEVEYMGTVMPFADLLRTIKASVKLRSFIYERDSDVGYGIEYETLNFNCEALAAALAAHSSTLGILNIIWSTEGWRCNVNESFLISGTLLGLSFFTCLKELTAPAHMLFGDPDPETSLGDPEVVLTRCLPSSLETLVIWLFDERGLGTLIVELDIFQLWPLVRETYFPNLELFILEQHDPHLEDYDEDENEELYKERKEDYRILRGMGIEVWPPLEGRPTVFSSEAQQY